MLFSGDCTHAARSARPDSQSRKSTRRALLAPNRYSISSSSLRVFESLFYLLLRKFTTFSSLFACFHLCIPPQSRYFLAAQRRNAEAHRAVHIPVPRLRDGVLSVSSRLACVDSRRPKFSCSDSILMHRKLQPDRLQERYFHFETVPRPLSLG
jgi:hypothetical protein